MSYYKAYLIFYYICVLLYFSTIFYQNKITKKLDIGLKILIAVLSLILFIIYLKE